MFREVLSRGIYKCCAIMTQRQKSTLIRDYWQNILKKPYLPTEEALEFCKKYKYLAKKEKQDALYYIAMESGFDIENAKKAANSFLVIQNHEPDLMVKAAERLKYALHPKYVNAFSTISALDCGIKFLVDLRVDVLDLLQEMEPEDPSFFSLRAMNNHLKDMLAFCFNVGFLTLERITWDSSCHMLQKISEYEAVHPIRNWADLKQRVGPYRRCYVFTHSSMPREPIVMLHTALTNHISSSIGSIINPHKGESQVSSGHLSECHLLNSQNAEDHNSISTAIFYSITSTQKGLRGIDLGNQLIKKVVGEILKEFPHISNFSSLSPVPGFREWLLMEISKAKETENDGSALFTLFPHQEFSDLISASFASKCNDFWSSLSQLLASNRWILEPQLKENLKKPLLKLCAHYLIREKRRSHALNSVAHFHLRNGAVLWRLNWAADLSPRGLDNSCGIMVNYRYYMDETENNSQKYIQEHYIKISDDVKDLLSPDYKMSKL